MSVIRTYSCLHCGREFDSWDKMPECPDCGNVRVQWVPKGGHIAGVSRRGDAEFKALADVFNLSDLKSVNREGDVAKPMHTARAHGDGGPVNFGGFAASINPEAARTNSNPSGAECVPTLNRVNFKARTEVGRALGGGQLGMPSVQSATTIDSTHRPKP